MGHQLSKVYLFSAISLLTSTHRDKTKGLLPSFTCSVCRQTNTKKLSESGVVLVAKTLPGKLLSTHAFFLNNSQLSSSFSWGGTCRKHVGSGCRATSILRVVSNILLPAVFQSGKAGHRLFHVGMVQISSRITKHFFSSWTR